MSQQLNGQEADQLIYTTYIAYLTKYSQLAAAMVVFYDHLITLDQEVELIWRKRWSKSKVLYLLCRYVGNAAFALLGLAPNAYCVWGIRVAGSEAILSTFVTQLIMQLRIQALYDNKRLSQLLFALFICEVTSVASIGLIALQKMRVIAEVYPNTSGCTVVEFPPYTFAFWIPILFLDGILFFLAATAAVKNFQRARRGSWSERFGSSLIAVLVRDNFGYFFCAFMAYLTNLLVFCFADPRFFSLAGCFAYSSTTVLGCRLILNLSEAYYYPSSARTRVGTSPWNTTTTCDFNTKPSPWLAPKLPATLLTTATTRNVSHAFHTRQEQNWEMELSTISDHSHHCKDGYDTATPSHKGSTQ